MKIKQPTLRKLRNRGLTPVRVRIETKRASEIRHGWILSDDGKTMRVQLVGEARPRRFSGRKRQFVTKVL